MIRKKKRCRCQPILGHSTQSRGIFIARHRGGKAVMWTLLQHITMNATVLPRWTQNSPSHVRQLRSPKSVLKIHGNPVFSGWNMVIDPSFFDGLPRGFDTPWFSPSTWPIAGHADPAELGSLPSGCGNGWCHGEKEIQKPWRWWVLDD